jgi:hypothetical protein
MFTYKKYKYLQANAAPRYKMGSPAYIQKIYVHHCLRAPLTVPLEHHRLLLPQAVAAHHLLPQEVVVPPLPTPPTPATVIRSSTQQPLLLVVLWPAMVAAPPHTAPGMPRPGCETICPQAPPITPSPDDGVCPQSLLRQPPEERVMAQHQGHQTNASSLPSLAQLVTPRHPHADVSLPTTGLSGALCNSTSCPRGATSAHANKHQIVSTSISYT